MAPGSGQLGQWLTCKLPVINSEGHNWQDNPTQGFKLLVTISQKELPLDEK